jgi:hypothetical protein
MVIRWAKASRCLSLVTRGGRFELSLWLHPRWWQRYYAGSDYGGWDWQVGPIGLERRATEAQIDRRLARLG